MKPLLAAIFLTAQLPAAVIFNAPDPASGFFDGYTDYFNYDGTGQIGAISYQMLPPANGITSPKVFGSASLNSDGSGRDPYLVMVAFGAASGTFDVESILQLQYNLGRTPAGALAAVRAEVLTNAGLYFNESNVLVDENGIASGRVYLNYAGNVQVPAGTTVSSWKIFVSVGEYGRTTGLPSVSLTIPPNSVEFIALTPNADPPPVADGVPEPGTWALAGIGLVIVANYRRRKRGSVSNRDFES